ncbi:DUF3325 domain-containing protein [Alloalcanivorax xenomutans]|uniref:DUF3325 domain-containing protein n=1 Tax=Alloalcanivorax xenomutans TaxID=1094342 RepID=UPI0029345641|nr:DUF3325 domain-containing protein [Alloalcanivorax xenomutans]WOD28936.1 DUF3325 domain-containing protein [Alloalcanivorax xenomutans]
MTILLALALGYTGLTCLALGMKRHHQELLGRKPTEARLRLFKAIGWLLLLATTAACLMLWPLGLALSMVPILVTLVGLPLIFLLPYRPALARHLAWALPLVAGGLAVGGLG